jgi:oligopeptide/dipeptide ABC transporter ATP-binding protein
MRPVLDVQDLHTHFETPRGVVAAVNGMNLVIQRGEMVGLVGDSGCGKTQFALSITRLIDPPGRIVSGSVNLSGVDLLTMRDDEMRRVRGKEIGLIFQNPRSALNPLIKIGDQIVNAYRAHHPVSRREARTKAIEMLGAVHLPDPERTANTYAHELSGGMAQRAMLALGLICSPRLIIADEPTTGLDVTVQLQIMNLMQTLIRDNHSSFLLITHDLNIVARYCHRVAVMQAGRVVEDADVEQLFHSPRHPYSQALVAATHRIIEHSRGYTERGGNELAHLWKPRSTAATPALSTPSAGEPVLQVDGITKDYQNARGGIRVRALNGVSLELRRGETLGLVGESGSGKTTLGRCMLRLLEPTSGRILFRGQDVTNIREQQFRPVRRRLQMVFQDPYDSLDPRMTVAQILDESLGQMNLPPKARASRINDLLRTVQLGADLLRRYPRGLSGGQQQRVGIARALAMEPDVIVLDEPTASLDFSARLGIIELLRTLQDRLQMAYLFISHDLRSVRTMSQRTAIMYFGRLVESGPTSAIFRDPIHPYTRALLSASSQPGPSVQRMIALEGEPPSLFHPPRGCPFHPRCPIALQHCAVAVPPAEDVSSGHWVACYRRAETRRLVPSEAFVSDDVRGVSLPFGSPTHATVERESQQAE